MTLTLIPIVAELLAAHNAHDLDELTRCFTPDATVRSEGCAHHGPHAIRAWFEDFCERCHPLFDLSDISLADGEIVLHGRLYGAFVPSPVACRYIIGLEDEKVVALRIVP